MSNEPTYYFVLPDIARPVGGVNVLMQYIDILNAEGYRAAPLYKSPYYRYKYASCAAQGVYSKDLQRLARQSLGRRARAADLFRGIGSFGQPRINTPLQRKSSDVFILPEYGYPELFGLFSDARTILAVQGVFLFLRAFQREPVQSKLIAEQFDAIFTTSDASQKAVQSLANIASHNLRLSVEKDGLNFQQKKKLQIAYMPRRRGEEVDIVVSALKARSGMADVSFVAIENMPGDAVVDVLSESLLFLSFSYREGFGLPPAEAMAAGCIVVGYTGVGGDEYFTRDIAFPINDSDLVSFIDTVQSLVVEYQENPERLDKMRKKASKHILETYNAADARSNLLRVWAEIHQRLTA